mmetsp:Transcript_27543/g.57258  ORF Transcript_27543/g.57258 Transcript_27543/m.57258 type:complete len:152 (+) Transcript_27543:627-1082(+)
MSLVILMGLAASQMASTAHAASVERDLTPAYHAQFAPSLAKHLACTTGTIPAGQIPPCLVVWQTVCTQSVASAAKASLRMFSAPHRSSLRWVSAVSKMSRPHPTTGNQLANWALSDVGLMAFMLNVAGVVRVLIRIFHVRREIQTPMEQSA